MKRWIRYPLIAVTAIAVMAAGVEAALERNDRSRYPMHGELIDVGGYRLNLSCTGTGRPTVVLIPGAGEVSPSVQVGKARRKYSEARCCCSITWIWRYPMRSLSTCLRTARPVAALGRTLAIAATLALTSGCMLTMKAPANLDYSRTRASEHGLYRGSIKPEGDSIPQGKLQQWTLHLETTDGTAVDSAKVAVDGGMPQHGHGLPTKPLVTTALGNGDHLVEGMKFNMGGWWVVKFRVAASAGVDSLTFNLKL